MNRVRSTCESFHANEASATPLAVQLADHIRLAIRRGQLLQGDCLPAAGANNCASRVTVLQAYRILQDERLVIMKRASGTVVRGTRAAPACGLLLDGRLFGASPAVYFGQIVSAVLGQFAARGWQPRIHILQDPCTGSGAADASIPAGLQRDLGDEALVGALVWRPADQPHVHEWLTSRRIPAVSLHHGGGLPQVEIDHACMISRGLSHLAGLGVRRAEVWNTLVPPDIDPAVLGRKRTPGLAVMWRQFKADVASAVDEGRRAARGILSGRRTLPQAIFLLDDWMAIGATLEILAAGVRIPDDVRLLVATHRGQVMDALTHCDLLVVDPGDIAASAMGLLDRAMAGSAGPADVARVDYRLVSAHAQQPPSVPATAGESGNLE